MFKWQLSLGPASMADLSVRPAQREGCREGDLKTAAEAQAEVGQAICHLNISIRVE